MGFSREHLVARLLRRLRKSHSVTGGDGQRDGVHTAVGSRWLVAALPFEPQPLPRQRRMPFFEGWFLRLVDHRTLTSIAVVFGSLRLGEGSASGSKHAESSTSALEVANTFDEHIVVVGYSSNAQGHHGTRTLYLAGSEVTLAGGDTTDIPGVPQCEAGEPRISWWSNTHGGLRSVGDDATLDLRLPGLQLAANISAPRVPWDPSHPNRRGPEGWLAPTGLLPCHYFVHSFGSPATYRLWQPETTTVRRRGGAREHGGWELSGQALTHMERNWGVTFPAGWVWAQAIAAGGACRLVLTGGLFAIGPLATQQYVVGLRAGALAWDFRTTDLDGVSEARLPCAGELRLNLTSRDGTRRLGLALRAPPESFGERIPVPTVGGFSDVPGCRESYAAVATVVAAGRRVRLAAWAELGRWTVPLAVLEFGGNYQCAV